MAHRATVYLTERDKRGDKTWDGPACQSCLDQHKQCIDMRRGETRVERPYTGDAACMFCEDDADGDAMAAEFAAATARGWQR